MWRKSIRGIAVVASLATLAIAAQSASSRTAAKPPLEVKFKWGTFKLDDRIAKKLQSGGKLNFVMVSYATSAPFWGPTRQGIKDASAKLGIDATFIGPATPSTETQVSEIESLITKGVDGLVVVAPDAKTLTPIINKALEAGIP